MGGGDWGGGLHLVPNPEGVPGGFGVHRTLWTSTQEGSLWGLGCPDPQRHQPGIVTAGFGGHRDTVLGIPVGFGVHIMGLIHGLILFSPPLPHPSSAAWPWGDPGLGRGEGNILWTVLGGVSLFHVSVIKKLIYYQKYNTYLRAALPGPVFWGGTLVFGGFWEGWGVLVSLMMVTLTWGCAVTPGYWCRRQNPWGGVSLGGSPHLFCCPLTLPGTSLWDEWGSGAPAGH